VPLFGVTAGHARAATATITDVEQLAERYQALHATADSAALPTPVAARVRMVTVAHLAAALAHAERAPAVAPWLASIEATTHADSGDSARMHRHVAHMRRVWCQLCSACLSARTSAIGRCRTRNGAFLRVDALGEIRPVVYDSSNHERPEDSCPGEFLASSAPAAGALVDQRRLPLLAPSIRNDSQRGRP
jgi:hypothetical protein